ncbi:MAG: CoA-binding protein [Bryobacteraceae bacterium]
MTRNLIDRFLACRRIAVVGVSRTQNDFSRMLFRELMKRGYEALPVNPGMTSVEGRQCFSSVQEIQPRPEAVLLMTPPKFTDAVVEDCAKAGVGLVWLYRAVGSGAVTESAVEFCRSHNIDCIAGYCPYMFLPGSGIPHSLHGVWAKLTGTWPKYA